MQKYDIPDKPKSMVKMITMQDTSINSWIEIPEENLLFLKRNLTSKTKEILKTDSFSFFHQGDDIEGNLFLVDWWNSKVVYLIKYKKTDIKVNNKVATEVMIWRSTSAWFPDITKTFFLGYLLDNFECIVSHDDLTWSGDYYWGSTIGRAKVNKSEYNVGVWYSDGVVSEYDENTDFVKWDQEEHRIMSKNPYIVHRYFIYKNL